MKFRVLDCIALIILPMAVIYLIITTNYHAALVLIVALFLLAILAVIDWLSVEPRKINLGIYNDGFIAKRANLDDIWGKTTGAKSGVLDPSAIGEHYLGVSPNVGSVTAYCLRRFGNPNPRLADQYKMIAEWIVESPMPGLWLSVTAGGAGAFGYIMTKELHDKLHAEADESLVEHLKSIVSWAKESKGLHLYNFYLSQADPDCLDSEGFNQAWNDWGKTKFQNWEEAEDFCDLIPSCSHEGSETEESVSKAYFSEKHEEFKKAEAEYVQIFGEVKNNRRDFQIGHHYYRDDGSWWHAVDTFLWKAGNLTKSVKPLSKAIRHIRLALDKKHERVFHKDPFWLSLPESSLTRKANEAIYRTIADLQRPCGVRDWAVDICGYHDVDNSIFRVWDSDCDEMILDYFVDRFYE